MKYGRDDQFTGVQHRDQHGVRVEMALVGSPNDAAERLLRVSAPPGAIAARHIPRDHRRPDLVFRPPIGRVERRIKEGPDGGELALGAFSQVFDLTSGPIVQGWVA